MKNTIFFLAVFYLLISTGFLTAQNTESIKPLNDELMDWYREAKFGMFIHFMPKPPVRLKDSDMSRTQQDEIAVREFNPIEFDAKEWVQIAKEAGMKYLVFTTKHHAGFCNWDSKLTDWDIMEQTEFKRDIVAELADACKEARIELGFYYSIADWHHPEYDAAYSNRKGFHFNPNPDADITKYMDYMYGQVKELCENYQPRLFWFDGSSGFRNPNRKRLLGQQEMVNLLKSYGAISNSRLGDDDALKHVSYLSMGDNMSPSGNIGVDFETAMTMNDSWSYNAKDDNWKSVDAMLEMLVRVVGNGGNYLLNVGPNRNGIIPQESVTRLKTMGQWLKKNGEAIYGTKSGPYPYELNWGSITQRNNGNRTTLYLNVANWPENGVLKLYGLNNKVADISFLASDTALSFEQEFVSAAGLNVITIKVPKTAPDPNVSVIVLQIEGKPLMEQVFLQQNDGSVILDAYHSTIHDIEIIPNKPLRPIEQKMFTVPKKGKGIMPARGLTVAINKKGEALSWDFKLADPGTFKVALISNVEEHHKWKTDGRMRVTVAGQSVENKLEESERWENPRMATEVKSSVSILGTVEINTSGMHTLTLEVTKDFTESKLNLRNVQLIPVN